jgi:N-acetylglutamate synthase-like GNAT family acetyltransferase
VDPRPYLNSDRAGCLLLFDALGIPGREAFERFLDSTAHFTVLEHDGVIAGCGGFTIDADSKAATLVWGMIRNDLRRLGLGRFLLMYRLRQITQSGLDIAFVHLTAPAGMAGFYEKQGFKRQPSTSGETVELVMKMKVCP